MRHTCTLILISLLLGLGCVELALRAADALLPADAPARRMLATALEPQGEGFWMRRYAQSTDAGGDPLFENRPDPLLGWSPIAGKSWEAEGKRLTINACGGRGPLPCEPDPSRFLVLAVGDSFTFGAEADDADTWPARLEALDPRLQVLNLGVSAYGLDQMALRLEQALDTLRPQLVVAAFIDDDLNRSMLGFRDYKKPRFVRSGDGLRLTNIPVGAAAEVLAEAQAGAAALPRPGLALLARNLWEEYSARALRHSVNERIVRRMAASAKASGCELLLLYLPHGKELADPAHVSFAQRFFEDMLAGGAVSGLNPRPAFDAARAGTPFTAGHYQGREAQIVAGALHERIAASASYRAFANRRP